MTQEELTNVFKHIVKKCDMLINNDHYEADVYTQDTVEDIAELCNHILDGNYGKLVELKEMDLEDGKKEELAQKYVDYIFKRYNIDATSREGMLIYYAYMHGMNQCLIQLRAQKGE